MALTNTSEDLINKAAAILGKYVPGEALGKEFATLAKAFLIDPVTDSLRYVPFHRHLKRGQTLRRMEQGLNRNQLILVAVDQQDRRTTSNFSGESRGVAFLRGHEHSGVADDCRRRDRPTQADMK